MYYIHLASRVTGLRAEKLPQTICFVTCENGSLSGRQSPLEQESPAFAVDGCRMLRDRLLSVCALWTL
jgi:hypothetical protein